MRRASRNQRAARTRTLIQLGGLVQKSGLTAVLGIPLGEDVQRSSKLQEPAAVLLGILINAREVLEGKESRRHRTRWSTQGREALNAE